MKLTGSYALKVALIYAAAGALWIFLSDAAVDRLAGDTALLTTFQTYKGWLFVLASAVLVFWLSWRALGDQSGLIRELRQTSVVFERTHEGVVVTDERKRIVSVNPAFERMAGVNEDRLAGRDLASLHSARHEAEFFSALERSIAGRGFWNGEIWNRGADGTERPFLATVTDIGADRQGRQQFAWIFTDISELKQAQNRLEHLAYYDPLTGLPNRLMLQDQLRRFLAAARDGNDRLAVLFIDLDNFRNVNDSFGHPIGDDLLVMVARRLRGGLPPGAGLTHMGGDEFVIHLPKLASREAAAECAQNTLMAIAEPFVLANRNEVFVSASIGICVSPDDAESVTELLQFANAAMYQAKRRGRNTWQHFDTSMVRVASRQLQLDARLRHALDADEFVLHFQPIVAGGDHYRVCGVEALVRWQSSDGRLVMPTEFIRATEESGLIVPLGDWVLEQACRQAASWREQGLGALPVSVNLSARQFQTGRLVHKVESTLERTGLPPGLLTLEITESMLMEQVQAGQDVLRRLRELGVHISLDDFGTGYSSLSYVKEFDLDTLKIDRSFILDLAGRDSDRDLVAAIISMARCLNLKVVAEGVEEREQLEILTRMACDCFQGYFFSRAVPASEVPAVVERLGRVTPEVQSSGL